jgi:hypothetical protein
VSGITNREGDMKLPTLHHRAARRARVHLVVLALVALGACARNKSDEAEAEMEPAHEPIRIHVRNENFLDMNVAVVASGVSRRLGQVSGNGVGEFTINYNVANGQSIYVTATPIGGSGRYTSPGLNVGSGQMIDLRIASTLRQSSVVVREP